MTLAAPARTGLSKWLFNAYTRCGGDCGIDFDYTENKTVSDVFCVGNLYIFRYPCHVCGGKVPVNIKPEDSIVMEIFKLYNIP